MRQHRSLVEAPGLYRRIHSLISKEKREILQLHPQEFEFLRHGKHHELLPGTAAMDTAGRGQTHKIGICKKSKTKRLPLSARHRADLREAMVFVFILRTGDHPLYSLHGAVEISISNFYCCGVAEKGAPGPLDVNILPAV